MRAADAPRPSNTPRTQQPWERRNVAETSQADLRTTLRGYDREQVRAVLERAAADCRVLQMQNASLKRQLASLEGVLRAYQQRVEAMHDIAAVPARTETAASEQPPQTGAPAGAGEQPHQSGAPAVAAAHPAVSQADRAESGARARDANGIRIVAHTFEHTLKRIDVALVAVPALPAD
jgi:DivIVA domain-containing protein